MGRRYWYGSLLFGTLLVGAALVSDAVADRPPSRGLPSQPVHVNESIGGAQAREIQQARFKHPKMDSALVAVTAQVRAGGPAAGIQAARQARLPEDGARVAVQIVADAPDAAKVKAIVAQAGGTVVGDRGPVVKALLPLDVIEAVAADPAVRSLRSERRTIPEAVTGEGIKAANAKSWHGEGKNGTGAKIAVIDGDFQGYQARQASGDLPANLTTFNHCGSGFSNGLDDGHGTTVAEIVHEVAPGAELFLICAETDFDYVGAEIDAWGRGVNVISHSRGAFNTGRGDGRIPTFEFWSPEDIIRRAREDGILWVNSAGNYADTHWSGTFNDTDGNDAHNFAPNDEGNTFVLAAGGTANVFLKWDDWGNNPDTFRSSNDYDLYLVRTSDGVIVAASEDLQEGFSFDLPTEALSFTNTGPTQTFWVAIVKFEATAAPRFDLFVVGNTSPTQYAVAAGSLNDHATSFRGMAAGAACWQNGVLEVFSSQGPTIDNRVKPDVAGYDSVSTASAGAFSACTTSGFVGTSAAAPHVAGAAAILKGNTPALTAAQLQSELEASSLLKGDRGAPGKDNSYGAGLLILPPAPLPPIDCAIRPKITVQTAIVSGRLSVTVTSTVAANRILKIEFGSDARPLQNALLDLTDGRTGLTGPTVFNAEEWSKVATFTVRRQTAGSPTTVPFVVTDRCGTWTSFVGGGPTAGF